MMRCISASHVSSLELCRHSTLFRSLLATADVGAEDVVRNASTEKATTASAARRSLRLPIFSFWTELIRIFDWLKLKCPASLATIVGRVVCLPCSPSQSRDLHFSEWHRAPQMPGLSRNGASPPSPTPHANMTERPPQPPLLC